MSDEARALIAEQRNFCRSLPVNAIFRIATDGSLTRDGGVVRAPDTGHQLMLDDSSYANVAQAGDEVIYPNGRIAKVVTRAGEASAINGTGVALVGSQLDNGDEIISTPQ